MKCQCTQGPKLRQTGYGPPSADLICPVCYVVFWGHDGKAEKERPAVWPAKTKDEGIQTWEIKDGHWR